MCLFRKNKKDRVIQFFQENLDLIVSLIGENNYLSSTPIDGSLCEDSLPKLSDIFKTEYLWTQDLFLHKLKIIFSDDEVSEFYEYNLNKAQQKDFSPRKMASISPIYFLSRNKAKMYLSIIYNSSYQSNFHEKWIYFSKTSNSWAFSHEEEIPPPFGPFLPQVRYKQ